MSFEDELRQTMRTHDPEAPTAADLPDRLPTRRPRGTWLPIAAAAAVVAIMAGVVAVAANRSNSSNQRAAGSTSVDCPAEYDTDAGGPWVPGDPVGVDGNARMVPDETPTTVRVCAYLHDGDGALTGDRVVDGNLAQVTQTLTWLPGGDASSFPCATDLGGTNGRNYLIGLSYPDGRVWVSAPGGDCVGASNGDFRTMTNLSAFADTAYSTGTWNPTAGRPAHPDPCVQDSGRLGQDRTFVPATPTTLAICADHVQLDADFDAAPFAAALNRLPTKPDVGAYACAQAAGGMPTVYTLRFGYAIGPDVVVQILDGCTPAVSNRSLAGDDDSGVMVLLRGVGVAP
ncbi:MAG: hypothetical protein QOH89_1400 [Pseudonocardiales bacterium]|nr:hypothetical protein [Pseudonocardiales bacterium]